MKKTFLLNFITGNEEQVISNIANYPTTAFLIVESAKGYMMLYNKYRKVWELTGGQIEKDESPQECVIRECKEECNQNIEKMIFVGLAKYEDMNAAIYYSFLETEEPFIENEEIKDLRWWKPNEIISDMDIYSLELIEVYISAI